MSSVPPEEEETTFDGSRSEEQADTTHTINGWDQPDSTTHIVMTGTEVVE